MKKLGITIIVVVSILVIPVAFTLLGEANDSSLSKTSQAIEEIQHMFSKFFNLYQQNINMEHTNLFF